MEKDKSKYEEALEEAKNGNFEKIKSMGLGEIAKEVLGKAKDQVEDVSENFVDGAKDFTKEAINFLSKGTNLNLGQQKALLVVADTMDKVMTSGEDREINFSDGKSIYFEKDEDTVKAFSDEGKELNLGDTVGQVDKEMTNLPQQMNGLDQLISNFKAMEQGASLGEASAIGLMGQFAKLMGLEESNYDIK